MHVQGLVGIVTDIRQQGRLLAATSVLLLTALGCGSSDPGSFDLELSANTIDIPVDDTGDVLVQIRCGSNTKRFIVQVTVEDGPVGLTFQVPAPGTVNCKNGDPSPSPMSVTPEAIGVGTYNVMVVGINYNEDDVMLIEPGVIRELPFTVNITP
jgi:hypothetical protein